MNKFNSKMIRQEDFYGDFMIKNILLPPRFKPTTFMSSCLGTTFLIGIYLPLSHQSLCPFIGSKNSGTLERSLKQLIWSLARSSRARPSDFATASLTGIPLLPGPLDTLKNVSGNLKSKFFNFCSQQLLPRHSKWRHTCQGLSSWRLTCPKFFPTHAADPYCGLANEIELEPIEIVLESWVWRKNFFGAWPSHRAQGVLS